MIARELVAGDKGFDCDVVVTYNEYLIFDRAHFKFVLRYIPRVKARPNDLHTTEVSNILEAGLSLMPVQHVEIANWIPHSDKGFDYGKFAADYCRALGIIPGVCVWLDLEGVDSSVSHTDVIEYCNSWYTNVAKAGYIPGIYVGYQCGLTRSELYHNLKFEHYWSAYNLDTDQHPIIRDVQMQQRKAHKADIPVGIDFPLDLDFVVEDDLGGLPTAMSFD